LIDDQHQLEQMDSDAQTLSILEHILPFIRAHQDAQRRGKVPKKPFILGVTGLQGEAKPPLCAYQF
jgi:pantothenate kinase-related protein Tda10